MEEISVADFLRIFRTYGMLIVSFVIGWTIIIAGITFFVIAPQYSSSTQLLVNRIQDEENMQRSDIETNIQLINTYKDILVSPVILDEVIEELDAQITSNELSRKITISNQFNSQIFTLEVRDESPQQAAVIANTISETFQRNVGDMMNVENVTIISNAAANLIPVSPNKPLSIIIGILMGLGNGVGVAFILFFMDHTVKDEKFVTEKLQWKSLGQIEEVSVKELISLENEETVEEFTNPSVLKSKV